MPDQPNNSGTPKTPAAPWVVAQDGQRVTRPMSESDAKAEAARRNKVQEAAGESAPPCAAKQVLMG